MNDSKDNPKPLPPDDFSETTPNFKVPNQNSPGNRNDGVNDWEKTNYNYNPKDFQQQQDEPWKKPSYNAPTPQNPPPDFNKTQMSGQSGGNPPPRGEWDKTQANIQLPDQPGQFEPSKQENYGSKQSDFGSTTPYINLPESERAKFENPPIESTSVVAETGEKANARKGGISWVWPTLALLGMFFFAVAFIVGVYFFFLGKPGFDIVVQFVPARSTVYVNGSPWGVSNNANRSVVLQGLKAGETKKIEIQSPRGDCNKPREIVGTDGKTETMNADMFGCDSNNGGVCGPTCKKCENGKCMDGAVTACNSANCSGTCDANGKCIPGNDVPDECKNIKVGDFATASKCANRALDQLGETFTAQQLLRAMNLYIVNFDKNKFNIKPNDAQFLVKAAGYIKKLHTLEPTTKVEVGGHTDSDGTDAKNMPLSINRATAVYNVLITSGGVDKSMMEVRGYGATVPKDTNATEEGKFHNRRIEYKAIIN